MEIQEMEKYENQLDSLKSMMEKYELDTEDISAYEEEMKDFHVTTPMVGKFSSGKSSLINALLGKKLLAVDTMPETSIPTEITYGAEDSALLIKKDETGRKILRSRNVTMDEVQTGDFKVDEWSVLKLTLHDEFLKTVPSVRIVDMPGFGTSIELHNKAINEYLPESKAYILTFPSRNSTIERDTMDFLKELKFYDMPVYVLVTKSQAVVPEELQQCVDSLKRQLTKGIGMSGVSIYCTNAKGKYIDVEGFKTVLEKLEAQSRELFKKEVTAKERNYAGLLKQYITTAVNKADCSVSDLEEEKEKKQKNLEDLKAKLEKERADFQSRIPSCIQSINSDVRIALENFAPEFAELMADNRQENARARVNSIVSKKIKAGLKNTFEPEVASYLDRVKDAVHVALPDIRMDTGSTAGSAFTALFSEKVVEKGIVSILAMIGLKIPNPIVQILAGVAALVISLFGKSNAREEAKAKAVQQFRQEYVPRIADEAAGIVEKTIHEQMENIDHAITKEIEAQVQSEQKALDDLIEKVNEEKAQKEAYLAELHEDEEKVDKILAEGEM